MLSVQNVRQMYLGKPYTPCEKNNQSYDETECTYEVSTRSQFLKNYGIKEILLIAVDEETLRPMSLLSKLYRGRRLCH